MSAPIKLGDLNFYVKEIEPSPPRLRWLSFADATRPVGTHWLGAVIIEASSFMEAVMRTHAMGVNPGGEVIEFNCDPDKLEAMVPVTHRERLLSRADLDELFDDIQTLDEVDGSP